MGPLLLLFLVYATILRENRVLLVTESFIKGLEKQILAALYSFGPVFLGPLLLLFRLVGVVFLLGLRAAFDINFLHSVIVVEQGGSLGGPRNMIRHRLLTSLLGSAVASARLGLGYKRVGEQLLGGGSQGRFYL